MYFENIKGKKVCDNIPFVLQSYAYHIYMSKILCLSDTVNL